MTYTLEHYLMTLHTGQWFGFNGEHTYANLIIHSNDAKPTEQECHQPRDSPPAPVHGWPGENITWPFA